MSFYRFSKLLLPAVILVTAFPSGVMAQESPPPTTSEQAAHSMNAEKPATPKRVKLVKLPRPIPLESFWDRLAWCETNSNWQNGGNWAGGLGIARSTWNGFGGRQYARTPDKATREQQIEIANNIAIFGWQTSSFRTYEDKENNKPFFRDPVGFNGWGALKCAGGKPHLVKYTAETIIAQKFKWGQKGRLVKDLQAMVGAPLTARYDEKTWAAHNSYLVKNGMDRSLAPRPKLKQPKRIPSSSRKKCQEAASQARIAGFPESEINTVMYVAWKESRCQPDAVNAKDENGGSFGLMQVNNAWTRRLIKDGVIRSRNDLLKPQKNMDAAFYIWTRNIMWSKFGWRAWGLR